MGTNDKLSKDENDVSVIPTLFRNMIGSLLYLIASRPDIFLVLEFVLDIRLILKNHTLQL